MGLLTLQPLAGYYCIGGTVAYPAHPRDILQEISCCVTVEKEGRLQAPPQDQTCCS